MKSSSIIFFVIPVIWKIDQKNPTGTLFFLNKDKRVECDENWAKKNKGINKEK